MVLVVSKPVSRVLSWTIIYLVRTLPHASMPPWGNEPGRFPFTRTPHCGVAPDRVYRIPMLPWESVSSYLAAVKDAGRYFSVALFLKSPSADVIRYPCPMEPGLSSPGGLSAYRARLSSLLTNCIIPQSAGPCQCAHTAGPCMEKTRSVSNSALHETFEKCVKINKWDCKLHSFLVC